ncbi:MerR family transcriptional regulator [Fictibacillus sp. 23RED33]|uniref:MerR family transcriptional regulator n=1 Tax=Fictibacillus sp. 23RED33 TaxID=2745879 RepID=UPI0018CDC00D|nr:MerR family transcriptional regulator [Fictibacillus sp. 23RED33]MBH0176238.1 MerR family transcriptional regulator [Fictibacillus sp. 23RED33]
MNGLLKKKDVTEAVGAPKTTIHDWMQEFSAFIPKIKNGQTVYYKPQAIDVLLEIKRMREEGLDKTQIAMELPNMGFAMDADETVNKVQKVRLQAEQSGNRDALMTVMQTMAVTMERMTELEKAVQESKEKQLEQERRNEELEKKIEKQNRYIEEKLEERDRKLMEVVRQSQKETTSQIAAAQEAQEIERKNKGWLNRWFGK